MIFDIAATMEKLPSRGASSSKPSFRWCWARRIWMLPVTRLGHFLFGFSPTTVLSPKYSILVQRMSGYCGPSMICVTAVKFFQEMKWKISWSSQMEMVVSIGSELHKPRPKGLLFYCPHTIKRGLCYPKVWGKDAQRVSIKKVIERELECL